MTPGHVESDLMELGVNACCGSGTLADQDGSVPKQDGLFALLDGLGVDLGDEAGQAHAGQEFGIDLVALVCGVGNGPESFGVGKNEVNAGSLK
jgi:hypothetical protein